MTGRSQRGDPWWSSGGRRRRNEVNTVGFGLGISESTLFQSVGSMAPPGAGAGAAGCGGTPGPAAVADKGCRRGGPWRHTWQGPRNCKNKEKTQKKPKSFLNQKKKLSPVTCHLSPMPTATEIPLLTLPLCNIHPKEHIFYSK